MKDITKILLATTDGVASHHGAMRAALLGAQLQLDGFDMLTVKRSALAFGNAATEFSHIQVCGPDLSAWIAGAPQAIQARGEAEDLAPIWNKAPVTAAELIVVGRQGLTRAARYGLGDVPRRLGNQAACDVLIGAPLASGQAEGQARAAIACSSQ